MSSPSDPRRTRALPSGPHGEGAADRGSELSGKSSCTRVVTEVSRERTRAWKGALPLLVTIVLLAGWGLRRRSAALPPRALQSAPREEPRRRPVEGTPTPAPRWVEALRFRTGADWIDLEGRLDRSVPLSLRARLVGENAGGWSKEKSFSPKEAFHCLLDKLPPQGQGGGGAVEFSLRHRGKIVSDGRIRYGWQTLFEGLPSGDDSDSLRPVLGPVFVGSWAMIVGEGGLLRGLDLACLDLVEPGKKRDWAFDPSPASGDLGPPLSTRWPVAAMFALGEKIMLCTKEGPVDFLFLDPDSRHRAWGDASSSRPDRGALDASGGRPLRSLVELARSPAVVKLDEKAGERRFRPALPGRIENARLGEGGELFLTVQGATWKLLRMLATTGTVLAEAALREGGRLDLAPRHVLRWQAGLEKAGVLVVHDRETLEPLRRLSLGPRVQRPWVDETGTFAVVADARGVTAFALQKGPADVVLEAGEWRMNVEGPCSPVFSHGARCFLLGGTESQAILLKTGKVFSLLFSPSRPEGVLRHELVIRPRTGRGLPQAIAVEGGRAHFSLGHAVVTMGVDTGQVEEEVEILHQPKIPPVWHGGHAYLGDSYRCSRLALRRPTRRD